jgi:hypothetical protein
MFHKECWDQIDPKQRIAWKERARRTVYRSSGTMVMGSYPPPDDNSAWEEMIANASSDVEVAELRRKRETRRSQLEAFAVWERDHPLSWWHRLVLRVARHRE